jgi:hypothetical protein
VTSTRGARCRRAYDLGLGDQTDGLCYSRTAIATIPHTHFAQPIVIPTIPTAISDWLVESTSPTRALDAPVLDRGAWRKPGLDWVDVAHLRVASDAALERAAQLRELASRACEAAAAARLEHRRLRDAWHDVLNAQRPGSRRDVANTVGVVDLSATA